MQNNPILVGDLIALISVDNPTFDDIYLVLETAPADLFVFSKPWFKISLWRFKEARLITFNIPESEYLDFFLPSRAAMDLPMYTLVCRPNGSDFHATDERE